ncbi:MAG: sporulation protein YjcZ [bacterium]|jgi:hypothetical protein
MVEAQKGGFFGGGGAAGGWFGGGAGLGNRWAFVIFLILILLILGPFWIGL